tara:strand:+ start:5584 stop:6009 length:426 start_codon:yes stop_codon:yes gene_type:complete
LILSIPYSPTPAATTTTTTTNPPLSYTPIPPASLPSLLLPTGTPTEAGHTVALDAAAIQQYTRHVFEGRFTPLKLVVNGRRGRRVIVVLGSDRKHYRVLDMDFRKREGRGEEGEGSEDEDEDGAGEGVETDGDGDVEMVGA